MKEIKGKPIDYAKSLPKAELKKVIKEISGKKYDEFLDRCRICFEQYLNGHMEQAEWWSHHAELVRK